MLKFPLGPSRFFSLYLVAPVQPSCLQDQIFYLLLDLFYSIPQSFSFIDTQCFSLPGFQIVFFSNISISNMGVTSHIPPVSLLYSVAFLYSRSGAYFLCSSLLTYSNSLFEFSVWDFI